MTDLKTTVKGRFVGGGLFEPRENNGKMKYSACVVLDSQKEADKIDAIIKNAIEEKWGNKKPAGLQDWGVRKGDDPEFEASYEQLFINPKSNEKRPPDVVIRRNGRLVDVEEDDDIVYPGCYVAVSVSAYGMDGDKNMKPCVALNLRAVMFWKDGERLGDKVNADKEFDGFDSEEADIDDDDFFGDAA